MGLSNEERFQGILCAIDRINHLDYDKSKTFLDLSEIQNLVSQLWHAAIGKSKNSTHWILGSCTDHYISNNPTDPWGIALQNQVENIVNPGLKDVFPSPSFDAFDGFLDIGGLLRVADKSMEYVFNVYKAMEHMVYLLRRYDDGFRADFKDLDKLISDIQGACFHIMQDNEDFPKAYILHHICKDLYGSNYPYNKEEYDTVTKWLVNNNMHHDLNRPMVYGYLRGEDLKWMVETQLEFEATKKNQIDRLLTALKICGRRFHYNHQHEDLLKIVKNNGSLRKYSKKIKDALENCKKQREESEKEQQKSNKEEAPRALDIVGRYGFETPEEIKNALGKLKKSE